MTSQAARDTFGRRIENLAREITASPRICLERSHTRWQLRTYAVV